MIYKVKIIKPGKVEIEEYKTQAGAEQSLKLWKKAGFKAFIEQSFLNFSEDYTERKRLEQQGQLNIFEKTRGV